MLIFYATKTYLLSNGPGVRVMRVWFHIKPKEIRRTLMTKTLKVFTMILATFVILGTGSVSAHHDDAKGSGVVYEGAGGR